MLDKKTKIGGAILVTLLVLAVIFSVFSIPKTKTHAYAGASNNSWFKYGKFYVKNVDENGDEFTGDNQGEFKITLKRYSEGSSTPDITEYSQTFTLGNSLVGSTYLDYEEVFTYLKENEAVITIEQTKAAPGYTPMAGTITLDYRYLGEIVGDTSRTPLPDNVWEHFPEPGDTRVDWQLEVKENGTLPQDTTLEEFSDGGQYESFISYLLTIKNLPSGPTTPITIKKIWDDSSDNDNRPDIVAFAKYQLSDGTTTGEVTSEGKTWTKNDDEWTVTLNIPEGATVTDWGESSVPDGYEFEKGTGDTTNNVYPFTNKAKPTYTEKYSYEDADNLPQDVIDTLPTRAGTYYDGDVVTPAAPSATEVKVDKTTYTFAGWTPTSVTIDGADAEFVGKWNAVDDEDPAVKKFDITYKLNGGQYNGSTADIVETYEENTWIKIHEAPTREGYKFTHWEGSSYQPGDDYQVIEDHTFTAMWEKVTPNPDPDPDSDPEPDSDPDPDPDPDDPETPQEDTPSESKSPKTGDTAATELWLVILGASAAAAIGLKRRYNK